MTRLTASVAALLCAFTPALGQTVGEAKAIDMGAFVRFDVQLPGANCSGKTDAGTSSRSGGGSKSKSTTSRSSSAGSTTQSVRLVCDDGTSLRARVRRDTERDEWVIDFNHKTLGRTQLRAVGN